MAPGTRIAGLLFVAGASVALVVLLLRPVVGIEAYIGRMHPFTSLLIVVQVMLFFGTLAFLAFRTSRAAASVPVVVGTIAAVWTYNLVALATAAVFELWIIGAGIGEATYRTVAVAETALLVAVLLLVHALGAVNAASHAQAHTVHAKVQDLVAACDRIRAAAEARGWPLAPVFKDLQSRVHFSEGIRRSQPRFLEVTRQLAELESLVASGTGDSSRALAERLIREIGINASLRP